MHACFLTCLLASLCILATTWQATAQQNDVVPNRIIVRWRPGSPTLLLWQRSGKTGSLPAIAGVTGKHATSPFISPSTLTSVRTAFQRQKGFGKSSRWPWQDIEDIAVVTYEGAADPRIVARKLSSMPDVLYAEPEYVRHIFEVPNDPYAEQQYYLPLIHAFEAWDALPSGAPVVIGIIDTGIDTAHVDLQNLIWRNPGETGRDGSGRDKRSNGVDDDANGFVDDWTGWDFVGKGNNATDNMPLPGNPHGTHVAGIAGAAINNATGIAGVAKNIRLMPVKVGADDPASLTVGNTSNAILYAASNGAGVINCSFGSSSPSFADQDVIDAATRLNTLIVAAAGNDGANQGYYPASYIEVVSVASTTSADRISSFSNRHSTVDVSAPGSGILSTIPGNKYDIYDGTSMASPVVAGVAAMIRQRFPQFSPEQVNAMLRSSADDIDALNPFLIGLMGTGRVNALKALTTPSPKHARVMEYTITDADGDGVFETGDELVIAPTVRNVLQPVDTLEIRVTNGQSSVNFDILAGSMFSYAWQTQESRQLGNAIRIRLPDQAPFNGRVALVVTFIHHDTVIGRDLITTTVNPSYRTISRNNISTTVNSIGNISFNDYPANEQGVGFRYKNGDNLLFESGIIIGIDPNHLPNVVRGTDASSKDTLFSITKVVSVEHDSVPSGIRAVSEFHENTTDFHMGISVRKNVYQSDADSLNNSIIVSYDITNNTDTIITGLHAGAFWDWDIGPSGSNNGTSWSESLGMAIAQNATRPDLPTVGMAMLSPYSTDYFAIDNQGDYDCPSIYDDFIRAEKWQCLSSGIGRASSTVTDISVMLGAGPFTLQPHATEQLCFAITLGFTLDELHRNLTVARNHAKAMGLNASPYRGSSPSDALLYIQGGPTVSPGPVRIRYSVKKAGPVQVDCYDSGGRYIATLLTTNHDTPGDHDGTIDIPVVSSGNYFLWYRTGTSAQLVPMGIVH